MVEPVGRERGRSAFWIDDAILDTYAPIMGRSRFGAAALAVYMALARRADPDGATWPSLRTLADLSASSERTVQRAIQLLELLGLVAVTTCFEGESNRQTSNHYVLLAPPVVPPAVDPDPARWPAPCRRTLVLPPGPRSQALAEALALLVPQAETMRDAGEPDLMTEPGPAPAPLLAEVHERLPVAAGEAPTPRQAGVPPVSSLRRAPASQSPRPRPTDTPPPVSLTPQEGNTREVFTVKENDDGLAFVIKDHFTIDEIGLSSGQVWAAALAELARDPAVSATDLSAWLRPAALCGRDGETLLLGVPNAVAQERITARLLPAVRAALAAVLGTPLPVRVVVTGEPADAAASPPPPHHGYPGIGTRPPPNEWKPGLAHAGFPRTVSS